jgi:VIT1/CCC1 family predicted Fe2+/Mn2+ transporter
MTMGALDTGGTVPDEAGQNHEEPHGAGMAGRLNWLRAGVLGANDGIVSTAGIVIGVAGATANRSVILTAGIAGLAAGALSMAVGEYVSVSTQRDTERALLAKERRELHEMPDEELAELTEIYVGKGLSPDVAALVARQLTDHDALLPLLAIALPPPVARVAVTVVAVALALVFTGAVAARLGHAPWQRQVLRNVVGGLLAMGITYGIGSLVGTAV